MTMTMNELKAARSLTADRDMPLEEDHPMEKPVYADDETMLLPRSAPRRMAVAPPTNHVTVVGYIYPQEQRRGEQRKQLATTRAWRQDLAQPVLERLDLLVMEEDGSTYLLELPISAVLVKRNPTLFVPDARVVLEGYLVNTAKTDRQLHTLEDEAFGHTDDERGLVQYQDLSLEVLAIRAATDEDVDGSWVQIRGQTTASPAFRRMDHDARLFQARTQVLTQLRKPSARAESRSAVQIDTRLPVMVSTRVPQANALYGRGNEVILEGRLQPFRFQLTGEDAALTRALARTDAEWAERQAPLLLAAQEAQAGLQTAQGGKERAALEHAARTAAGQVRREQTSYLRRRIRLQGRTKIGITVTYAELVRGQVVRLDAARQTWTMILQARQDRRLGIRRTPLLATTPTVADAVPGGAEPQGEEAPTVMVVETMELPALTVPEEAPAPKRRKKVVAVVDRPAADDAPSAADVPLERSELAAEPAVREEELTAEPVPAAGAPLPIGDGLDTAPTESAASPAEPSGDVTDQPESMA